MFCQKCGNQLPDGSVFCMNCGTPQPRGIPLTQSNGMLADPVEAFTSKKTVPVKAPMDPAKKKKLRLGITIGAIVVILGILAAIFLPMLFGGNRNPEDPIRHYFNFINTADYGEFEKCVPEGYLNTVAARRGYPLDLFKLQVQAGSAATRRNMTYQVLSSEPILGGDLEELREDLYENYYEYFIPGKVSAAFEYKLLVSSGDGDPIRITVFCYDGSWYIDPQQINIFFPYRN